MERQLACGLSEENSLSLGVLPLEIWVRVATKLDTFSLFSFGQACKLFSEVERVVPCDQGRRKDMLLGLLAEVRDLYDDSYPLTEDFLRWLYDLTTKKCDISGLSNLTDEVKRHKVFFSLARLGHLGLISACCPRCGPAKRAKTRRAAAMSRCQGPCGGIFTFWDENTCNYAAREGTRSIQWLRAQNPPCPWGHPSVGLLLGGAPGDPQVPQEGGRPVDPSMCPHAAAGAYLETAKWFGKIAPGSSGRKTSARPRLAGGTWTCSVAQERDRMPLEQPNVRQRVGAGHLDVLRWLRQRMSLG